MTLDIEFSVVSGSNPELLLGCLRSLTETMQGSRYSWRLTVTCNDDDASLAGRVQLIAPGAQVIRNLAPRGFAENHNVVLQSSIARYVWLLNDDLIILPGTIEAITAFLDDTRNARVAVVSPRLLNPDGTLQRSTYGFPTMPQTLFAHSGLRETSLGEKTVSRLAPLLRPREGASRFWDHNRTIEVDTFRGACVAMRMEAVREVGVMVEVARVGAEETEWHRRFRDRDWKVVFFAEASVIHFGSQTVAASGSTHYPEYLKGALYFFRQSAGYLKYHVFCAALLSMFAAKAAYNAARLDRGGVSEAKKYMKVAWQGFFAPKHEAARGQ